MNNQKPDPMEIIDTCIMLINQFDHSNKKLAKAIRKAAQAKILLELTKL